MSSHQTPQTRPYNQLLPPSPPPFKNLEGLVQPEGSRGGNKHMMDDLLKQQQEQAYPNRTYSSQVFPVHPVPVMQQPDPSTLLSSVAQHFDRSLNIVYQVLLARMNSQDELLAKQQNRLESFMEKMTESQDQTHEKVLKDVESLRIDLQSHSKTMKNLKSGIPESMVRFRADMMKELGIEFSSVRERLYGIEEGVAAIQEEMGDSSAALDPSPETATGPEDSSIPPTRWNSPSPPRLVPVSGTFVTNLRSVSSDDSSLEDWDDQHRDDSQSVSPDQDEKDAINLVRNLDLEFFSVPVGKCQDTLEEPEVATINSLNASSNREVTSPANTWAHSAGSNMQCPAPQSPLAVSDSGGQVDVENDSEGEQETYTIPQWNHTPGPSSVSAFSRAKDQETYSINGEDLVQSPVSGSPSTTSSLPDPYCLLREIFSQHKPRKVDNKGKQPAQHVHLDKTPSKFTKSSSKSPLVSPQKTNSLAWSAFLSPLSSMPDSDEESNIQVDNSLSTRTKTMQRNSESALPSTSSGGSLKRPRSLPGTDGLRKSKRIRGGARPEISKEMINSASLSSRRKRSIKSPELTMDGVWPRKHTVKHSKTHQFVQCDRCLLWYHWGCVGIREGDYRLEEDAEFVCPPCVVSGVDPGDVSAKEGSVRTCSRPNCNIREKPSQEYFIERIIGRFERTFYDGLKRYSWLVKWEGYDVSNCSWTPGDELPKPAKLIEEFEIAAKAEGVILSARPLALLKEAMDGGWDRRTR